MRYWLVMPAAGAGQRFGAALPKQYALLEGRTVIEWALAPFVEDARCAGVVVALAPGDAHFTPVAARLERARAGVLGTAAGGVHRSASVRSALASLHDAARPCLPRADLEALLEGLAAHPLGGVLAVAVADTLKRAQGGADALQVAETVERARLWRALTPQMFRYGKLCAALDAAHAAGRLPSDEAQALEWQGEHPALVEGSAANLKITTPADLTLAAATLRAQRS